MRILHCRFTMLAFSVEVVIQVGNEHYVLCLFRKHAAKIINFVDFKARFVRIVWKKVQFSSLHAEKWMIFCNFVATNHVSMKPIRNKIFCVSCKRSKMLFESQAKADNYILYNKEEIEEENGKTLVRSYYCRLCGGWHVATDDHRKGYQGIAR